MSRTDRSRPTAPLRENRPHCPPRLAEGLEANLNARTRHPNHLPAQLLQNLTHLASYGLSMSFIMGAPGDEYMDMSTEVLQCILQNPCALSKLGASLPDSTSAHGRGAEKVGPTGSQRKVT